MCLNWLSGAEKYDPATGGKDQRRGATIYLLPHRRTQASRPNGMG